MSKKEKLAVKLEQDERRETVRKFRKLFNVELADLAKRSDLSVPMISAFENGARNLSAPAWKRVVSALLDYALEQQKMSGSVAGSKTLEAAQNYVHTCTVLPWMKQFLSIAKAELNKIREAQNVASRANLDDPNIKVIFDSYAAEIAEKEDKISKMQEMGAVSEETWEKAVEMVAKEISEKFAGHVAMDYYERALNKDPEAAKEYKHYQKTGKAPRIKIKSIEKVGSTEE